MRGSPIREIGSYNTGTRSPSTGPLKAGDRREQVVQHSANPKPGNQERLKYNSQSEIKDLRSHRAAVYVLEFKAYCF